ncbi:hypothetical protein D3C72_1314570 [compost metagenome]
MRDHVAEPLDLRAAHAVVHQVDTAAFGERQHALDHVFAVRHDHMRRARVPQRVALGGRARDRDGDDARHARHLQRRDAGAR